MKNISIAILNQFNFKEINEQVYNSLNMPAEKL